MRNTLSQAIRIVFTPETILPFLAVSVCLSIFGSAIYDIVKNLFGTTTTDLIHIALVAFLILAAIVALLCWVIAQRLSRLTTNIPIEVRRKALDQKYPGLILLVSKSEACATAIRFHQPTLQRCWLICSPQTLEQAQILCQQFPQVCVDQPIVINDIYDPLEVYARVNDIYRDRLPPGWRESDVIADYTGMTAHASVGTVLACVGTARSLQYTPAKFDQNGKPVGSLNPIRILLQREVSRPGVSQ
jgi:CRISPR-associated protein (Cas_Cas02710)